MSEKPVTKETEIKDKLLKLFHRFNPTCIWSKCGSHEDFTISNLGLGFVADLVLCRLSDDFIKREVVGGRERVIASIVVKYNSFDNAWIKMICTEFETSIICSMICQSGLGPALLFTDKTCNVFEFIEGRNHSYEDDFNREITRKTAEVMARLHSLRVPVSKRGSENYWKAFDIRYMPDREIFTEKNYLPLIEKNEKLRDKYLDLARQVEPVQDLQRILSLINAVGSPIVFSHNDFNRRNRRITADGSKLVLLDFDFSNYNARGIDLGRYYSNYHHHDDMFGDEGFPTDEEMTEFLEEYRQQWALRNGGLGLLEQEIHSLEQLRRETKIFTLFAYYTDLNFGLWMYGLGPNEPDAEYFLNIGLVRWQGMKRLERQFTEDGTIPYIINNPR